MKFQAKHSIIRSVDGRIKYKVFNLGGREHYNIGIWIDGSNRDLDQVVRVDYILHASFSNRVRTSRNRLNNFSVTFWTWGMFDIPIKIHLQNGKVEEVNYYLEYKLPPDDGSTYLELSE
ncbi:pYEATS domain-containing protein [Cerasicoccus arenae]|uniref:YEATS domain-containing protein n=1 Tax=Cerasicoccus arenae TaxID=424488 RepID=A0A8J3DAA8_9BACT|nr:pYEATS domain-containing protein [Cerasicoccus arenae]MBK1859297.1 hypothetical protein [Cerasicoccus arenae]GHB94328.1 hypothetical protein GCM10007047_07520 [Cerasicoccus arenae]